MWSTDLRMASFGKLCQSQWARLHSSTKQSPNLIALKHKGSLVFLPVFLCSMRLSTELLLIMS